jgi:class 3 adenylate cyclase
VTLQARIGVASGVVVIGDLVREGVTQENAAISETTNQAARRRTCEPNTIVISPRHRLIRLFSIASLATTLRARRSVHVRQVLAQAIWKTGSRRANKRRGRCPRTKSSPRRRWHRDRRGRVV